MSQDTPAIEPKKTWRNAIRGNVLMMGLVSLFTDFSSEMMNPLLPFFIAGLVSPALAPFYIGLMEGLAETTASLLKIFSGRLSDKLGRRKALVVGGYGLSSLVRPAMALAMAGWHIVALKFLDRVGKGIRTAPRDALIGDSVGPEHRGLAFSFHRSMDHFGAVLGPVVAIAMLYYLLGGDVWTAPKPDIKELPPTPPQQMDALRIIFLVAIIPGALAMASLIFKVREISPTAGKPTGKQPVSFKGWRDLGGKFYGYVAIVVVFALGNSSDLFIVYLGSQYFGLGLMQVMLLWIALHLSKIVFSIPGGILSDKLGRRPLIVAGWTVYALIYLGLAIIPAGAENAWMFWLLVVAYGFYHGMTEGVEKALVADFSPRELRGTAFGVYHAGIGIAALPASIIFGVLWTVIGRQWAFGIGAAMAALATLLMMLFVTTTKPQE